MTHDALIFDIDGTLWNASSASAKGWNLGLAKLGVDRTVSAEQIGMVAGNPYEKCVDILLPGLRACYPELLNTLNICEIEAVRSDGGEFFDGVVEGIIRLAGEYKVYLMSNCQEWYLQLFLELSGLKPILSGVDCYGMSGLPKNEMLSRMKRDHSLTRPVYIGDTASDEKAAELEGFDFILVSWGFGKPEGNPETVESFAELLNHLRKKRNADTSNQAVRPTWQNDAPRG